MTTPIPAIEPKPGVPSASIGQLPVSSTRFIGREREIDQITQLLQDARLVTLTGPGGCGKTRLAVAAAQARSSFEHGAWFVDLSGLDEASLVIHTVATTLGVPETRGRALPDILTDYLRPKQLLLILDNCEHLLSACADLAQRMLDECPGVRLLATSREPLGLSDESVWLVPSLSVPSASADMAHVAMAEAVQLFMARATEALPDFKIDEHNAATIAQICRRLDGIPLAIELAAVRVKLLDAVQIAARLDDALQLLTRGQPMAASRHQTLRAALEWSYRLLQPREQQLFVRLAVFAGGCTLDDVEAICADDQLPAAEMLDLVSDLVDKSLVTIAERVPGVAVRYRLLEPIRQYALECLRDLGGEAALRDRHLAYFTVFAEQADAQLKGADQLRWLQRLDREHDNLRAALDWSGRAGTRSAIGLRLAAALRLFWQRRTYLSEGRRWLESIIAKFDQRTTELTPAINRDLARALVACEWLGVYRGEYATTRSNLDRALTLTRAQGEHVIEAQALGMLTVLHEYTGDMAAAQQYAAEAVAAARQSGDIWTLALVTHFQGRVLYRRGEAAGRVAVEASARLFREIGDKQSMGTLASTLAGMTPDLNEARALHEEALAIFQELGHREATIISSSNLAGLALLQGDLARAEPLYELALAQARDLNARVTVAFCQRGLGRIHLAHSDWSAAERCWRESAAINQVTNHQTWLALSIAGLARIAAARGQLSLAAQAIGAIEGYLQANAITLDADDQVEWDQHHTAVYAAITPATLKEGRAAGQTLTLEQTLHLMATYDQASGSATPTAAVAPELRIIALGPMRVLRAEQVLTTWPFAKVKELLFYLISQPPRTKAQLGLALWPDASPAQLRNSLSTTLYHLRRVLGQVDWIVFEDDHYRFNRDRAGWIDVDEFESNLAQAARISSSAPERAIALLQAAVALYQGDFVEDLLDGDWFLLRREELRRKYLEALLSLGRLHFARQEYAHAAEVYRRAIDKDEVLEAAHRELMRCYARAGERGQALRHYQTLTRILRDELGSPPAADSVALYERLKRGEDV
ncbi:MAG: BTAD domain-containing putative transcriptional regulator [Anaerolineae bacterium]